MRQENLADLRKFWGIEEIPGDWKPWIREWFQRQNAQPRRGTGFGTPYMNPAGHGDKQVRGSGEWEDQQAGIVHLVEQVRSWGAGVVSDLLGVSVPDTKVGTSSQGGAGMAGENWGAVTRSRGLGILTDSPVQIDVRADAAEQYLSNPKAAVIMALHELTHAALMQGWSTQINRYRDPGTQWVHEGLADYVALKIVGEEGLTQGIVHPPEGRRRPAYISPVENGYHSAARFFYWMDEQWPGAAKTFAREVAGGAQSMDGVSYLATGHPLEWVRDRYYADSGDWAP